MIIPSFNAIQAYQLDSQPKTVLDGYMGLSFKPYNDGFITVLDTLKSNGLINVTVFSMYLSSGPSSPGSSNTAGEIIFGGYDPKYAVSDFQFVNVTQSNDTNHWTGIMTAFRVGENIISNDTSNYTAIFDSGTSLLSMPQNFIDNIIDYANAQGGSCELDSYNMYTCSCGIVGELPSLFVYFGNMSFEIPASSYFIQIPGVCMMFLMHLDNPNITGPDIILGDVFMKNYYALYSVENGTVGLAKAAPTPGSPSGFPIWAIFLGVLVLICVIFATVKLCQKKKSSVIENQHTGLIGKDKVDRPRQDSQL